MFLIFALAGLSTLSLAKSSPETNSELNQVVVMTNNAPEQVKCKLTFKRCSGSIDITIILSSDSDCKGAQMVVFYFNAIYLSQACD